MIEYDDDEIPIGWEDVTLTDAELDAMCNALDHEDTEFAEHIVERAYDRLYSNIEAVITGGTNTQ